jgi:hypothetical protein
LPIVTKHINFKLLLSLSLGFFLFTIIGTLSHELGHFSVARSLDYNAEINYQSCWHTQKQNTVYENPSRDVALIKMAGPLQTMLTGSLGVFLLFRIKRDFVSDKELNFKQWFFIFLTLFWSREVFNFLMEFAIYFKDGYFPTRGDEESLALHFDLPLFAIAEPTAIAGSIVLGVVFFKFIPLRYRTTFLLAGVLGSAGGYYFWMVKYGPLIMP